MSQGRQVVFVCSGNTCRSPLAAAMLTALIEGDGSDGITVGSAGIAAWDGSPASEGSYLVGLERGLDLGPHRARVLTPELVRSADIVLTMTTAHAVRARDLGGAGRVHPLAAYAAGEETGPDVRDPFGGSLDDYRAVADELDILVAGAWARLRKLPR